MQGGATSQCVCVRLIAIRAGPRVLCRSATYRSGFSGHLHLHVRLTQENVVVLGGALVHDLLVACDEQAAVVSVLARHTFYAHAHPTKTMGAERGRVCVVASGRVRASLGRQGRDGRRACL
jgi:hypothetical protein